MLHRKGKKNLRKKLKNSLFLSSLQGTLEVMH